MPEGLLYQQDFITGEEEAALIAQIGKLPLEEAKYKAYRAKRRTAAFGSSYNFESSRLGAAPPIPPFLSSLREQVARLTGNSADDFRHALVTEYRPGTQLGWHRDVGEFDLVAGVSLAGSCRMRFRRHPPRKGERVFSLDLEPRSLYVLRDEIRWVWQHSIAPAPELRYSVTLRTLR
jgi:alkylated DNA repair dioxygenase AlkB